MAWQPRSYAQEQALLCPADILLFGGAAGSLKSETMLMDAVQEHRRPGLRAILLRRSYPELEKSLIRRSRELYPAYGGVFNEQKRRWTFPAGGAIEFGYCESEKDIYRYQGAEYSFIGFDESTHFSEFPIRYMLSRLRSTDPGMRLRVRLATNPGNIGHATHKDIFHGQQCSHCRALAALGFDSERDRRPFAIYRDAVWPSDKRPIGKSTCFIPGRLSDHTLLGGDYARSLDTLPGAFRKALLEGCWDVYEGQYFDNWEPARMVAARARMEERPEWPHWLAVDYGFSGSQAAAYLLCRSPATPEQPRGRKLVLEEFCAAHMTAEAFGAELGRRFRRTGRRIVAAYLSPDAWNQRGDGHTIADQLIQASGFPFEPASNDRIGGAMLVYTELDRGELVIADTCSQLREALPTRIHDPDRPDDVKKIAGDPLDDCMDALRYGVYSYVAPPRPPQEEAVRQAMTSGDATIAMLQRRQAEEKLRKAANLRYLPGRRRG